MKNVIKKIRQQGFVSNEIRTNELKHMNIGEIRNWLEVNGFDRRLAIETTSTEIAICTPEGILMQVRAEDNNQLGMWGGITNPGETQIECAIRELFEETGIKAKEEDLELFEIGPVGMHTYANGNQGISQSHRYLLKLDYVPEIKLDLESSGYYIVRKKDDIEKILKAQRDYIWNLLKKMYL